MFFSEFLFLKCVTTDTFCKNGSLKIMLVEKRAGFSSLSVFLQSYTLSRAGESLLGDRLIDKNLRENSVITDL